MNGKKTGAELINPYSSGGNKGEQVEKMFDAIAPAYDFMNTAMTFGLHKWWRNRALNALRLGVDLIPYKTLDVATGTGDVAFKLIRKYPIMQVTGIDLSEGMLNIARAKLQKKSIIERALISFQKGDSMDLPFEAGSFDLVTVAYGVRNFEDLRRGYRELWRVLRPGGKLCVIELSCPRSRFTRFFYNLYSRRVIPAIGRMISGDSRAYTYLPESIAAAPQRDDMTAIIKDCGFSDCRWKSLTLGTVTYYIATK